MNKLKVIAAAFAGLTLIAGHIAYAQDTKQPINLPTLDRAPSNDDVQLFQKDLKSAKKQVIAANIELKDDEAQAFWPVYDRYTAEMAPLLERKFRTIAEYAGRFATLSDDEADAYIKGRMDAEEAIVNLRVKYIPAFRKVLPAKTAALFTQIDWRLDLLLDMQMTSQLPLIEP